ncbi:MAG: hypothetical protein L0G87_09815 [Renibacterium salmoninarum]|nr:hypothetical protein [Renibacterium salmoninarum]
MDGMLTFPPLAEPLSPDVAAWFAQELIKSPAVATMANVARTLDRFIVSLPNCGMCGHADCPGAIPNMIQNTTANWLFLDILLLEISDNEFGSESLPNVIYLT